MRATDTEITETEILDIDEPVPSEQAAGEDGTDEAMTDSATPEARDPAPGGRRSRRARILLGLAFGVTTLAVLAVAALCVNLSRSVHRLQQDERINGNVIAVARQEILNLTTLSHKSSKADFNRVLQGATGTFKQQMQSESATFQSVLSKNQVISQGKIDEAGVQAVHGDSATVLVAAEATVHNRQDTKGEPRLYRMSVQLQRVGGNWLVSNVEIVP